MRGLFAQDCTNERQLLRFEQCPHAGLGGVVPSPGRQEATGGSPEVLPGALEEGHNFFASTSSTAPASSTSLLPKLVASPGRRSSRTSIASASG